MGAHGRPVPSRLADAATRSRGLLEAMAETGRGIAEITYGPLFEIEEVARLSKELGVRITWGSLLTGLFGGRGAASSCSSGPARSAATSGRRSAAAVIITTITASRDPYHFVLVPAFAEVLGRARRAEAECTRDPAWRERARADVTRRCRPTAPGDRRASVERRRVPATCRGGRMHDLAAERGATPSTSCSTWPSRRTSRPGSASSAATTDPDELQPAPDRPPHRPRRPRRRRPRRHAVRLLLPELPPRPLGPRRAGACSLEQAVWRLSGQPADVFGIPDRGRIAPQGRCADLVAFDPDTIAPLHAERVYDFPADGDRLVSRNTGIEHVWVNGDAHPPRRRRRRGGPPGPDGRPGAPLVVGVSPGRRRRSARAGLHGGPPFGGHDPIELVPVLVGAAGAAEDEARSSAGRAPASTPAIGSSGPAMSTGPSAEAHSQPLRMVTVARRAARQQRELPGCTGHDHADDLITADRVGQHAGIDDRRVHRAVGVGRRHHGQESFGPPEPAQQVEVGSHGREP